MNLNQFLQCSFVNILQELQFMSGLVRLGQFQPEELQNVIEMLFPLKTPDEKKEIMARLTEGYTPPPPQNNNLTVDQDPNQ